MQALIALVSPDRNPKKQRKNDSELVPDSDEEEMYEASAHESEMVEIESDDDQPLWARKQEERMFEEHDQDHD